MGLSSFHSDFVGQHTTICKANSTPIILNTNLINIDIYTRDEMIQPSHDMIGIDTKGDNMIIYDTIRVVF